MLIKFCILYLLLIIKRTYEEDDECLYAIQRQKECFKIPMNSLNESCCYLEMDLNKITTTACIRVKNDPDAIEKRIFRIRENEEHYTLENFKVKCNSNYYDFSTFIFLNIIILLYI